MVERLKKAWNRLVDKLKTSLQRFPETIILSTATAILGILINHEYMGSTDTLKKACMALAIGIPISATIVLLVERLNLNIKLRLFLDANLIVSLILFYLMIPETIGQRFMVRYGSSVIIFLLLFTLVPYFFKRRMYAIYCIKLATSFLVTYLYTLVLFAGSAAMIFTVDQLFNLNINSDIYGDLFLITTGIFGVTYFLGSIPFLKDELTLEDFPKVFKVLSISIVMPLLTAYTLILYAYFIKILFNRNWPEGLVGNLVLWYGWISIIILFCIFDIRENKTWPGFFNRFFPIAFLVPLGMLISTIWIRTSNYGITVARYYVWVAAVWFLVIVLYFIINKWRYSTMIIGSLILFIFISAFGPIDGYDMSIRSQNNQLEKLLIKNDMLSNSKIIKNSAISKDDQGEINSILNYMNSIESIDKMKYVPQGFVLTDTQEVFGFEYNYQYGVEKDYFSYYLDNPNTIVNTSKYDYVINFYAYNQQIPYEINNEELSVNFTEKMELVISYQDEVIAREPLENVIFALHQKLENMPVKSQEDLTYALEIDKARIVLEFRSLYGNVISKDNVEIESMEGKIWLDIYE